MQNVVSNSELNNNSGNIQVGNITINISQTEEFKNQRENLKSKTKARDELIDNIKEFKATIKEKDKSIEAILQTLEEQAVRLENDCQKIRDDINFFIETYTIILINLLHDSNKSEKLIEVEQLLKEGEIHLANEKLVMAEILLRRKSMIDLSTTVSNELDIIARELAIKAKTILLQVDFDQRFYEAYKAYTESLKTSKSKTVALEFAKFLYTYDVKEQIETYKQIIVDYRDVFSPDELASAYTDLAFSETQNYQLTDSKIHYEEALKIYQSKYDASTIKDLEVLNSIIDCKVGISRVYSRNHEINESDKVLNEVFETCKHYDINTLAHISSYSSAVISRIDNLVISFKSKPELDESFLPKFEKSLESIKMLLSILDINKGEELTYNLNKASYYDKAGVLLTYLGRLDEAEGTLKFAERLLLNSDRYKSGPIKIMTIIKTNLSAVVSVKNDIRRSVKYLTDAIYTSKMLINVSKRETQFMIAGLSFSLADLEWKRKDSQAYLYHKQTALNYYVSIYSEDPACEIQSVLINFENLIIRFFGDQNTNEYISYLSKLLDFFQLCLINNKNETLSISLLMAQTYNTFGVFYEFVLKETGKANGMFVKAINLVGIDNYDDERTNNVRTFAAQQLQKAGVYTIIVNGKPVSFTMVDP